MRKPQQIQRSEGSRHGGRGLSRRPLTLMFILLLGLGGLLFGRQVALGAEGAGDATPDASASPSDQPPAPQAPAAEVAKPSCVCVPCGRGCGRRRARVRRCCRVPRACGRADAPEKPDPYAFKELFDGKTLKDWKVPKFGGEGKVHVEDGTIIMEMGADMTGITYTGQVPRDNYELEYEGARLDGIDFFATLTFPVGKDECSLVTGGWGGTVVGISCIDYYDASDNLTTTFHDFKDKQWYKFRVRVTPAKIEAWIDDGQVIDQQRKGHKISIRDEVDLCRPLGISSWCTKGGVRNIRLRKLKPPAEQPQPPKPE